MKKFILTAFLFFLGSNLGFCSDFDYQKVYRELETAGFSYQHNVDPMQYYDYKDTTWSPYPLLRLKSPLYFKTITLEPGYYQLTPREHNGKDYILVKEAGFVKYIIPAYKKDFVPEFFYEEHLPKPKLTFGQKFQIYSLDFIGKHFAHSKRKPAAKTYLELTDLDNNFVSMVVYYNEYRYYLILRTVRL